MNERIEKLIEQLDQSGLPYQEGDGAMTVTHRDLEYFAQLIVEECASVCYTSGLDDSDAHAQNLLFEFNIDNCRDENERKSTNRKEKARQ